MSITNASSAAAPASAKGGGDAMPEDQRRGRSAVLLHLPFAVVLVLVAIGIVRLAQYYWREGTVLIGLALLVAAALRALLAGEQAGLLAIRSRSVDVLLYSAFGVAVLAVALTITGGPFG